MPDLYKIDRLYVFFIAVYLAEGLVGIAYEPISYLLKDGLGLGPAQSAAFVAWMTLPFLFKPVLGVLSDAFPLRGRRRVPWLMLSAGFAAAGWGALAFLPAYRYGPTLFLLTAVNVGIVFSDVLCDGVMVERGQAGDKTGLYQAVQIGTLYACALATGLGGGWLSKNASTRTVFGLTALFPALILLGALLVPEDPGPPGAPRRAAGGLAVLVKDRRSWAVAAVILLVNFTPFQGTAFFYFQNEHLRFSKVMIGALSSLDGVSGLLGAALFWRLYNRTASWRGARLRLDAARLARLSTWASVPLTLLYLGYRGQASALLLTALLGAVGVAARLSLMDLAARAAPAHGEAAGFALFMSVFNLAAWGSNAAGAAVYGALAPAGPRRAIDVLIVSAAACSALAIPLLRFLPESRPPEEPA